MLVSIIEVFQIIFVVVLWFHRAYYDLFISFDFACLVPIHTRKNIVGIDDTVSKPAVNITIAFTYDIGVGEFIYKLYIFKKNPKISWLLLLLLLYICSMLIVHHNL